MKNKFFIAILIVGVFLTSCASAAPRADNFSFVYKYYACNPMPVYILDSANETLVHTPIGDTVEITLSFRLTDEELESIYQKAVSIDFFEYPSNFIVPENQMLGYRAPASNYELNMTNGEKSNFVTWTDGIMAKPGYKNAQDLQDLENLIYEIIQSHPEIHQLPEPKAGCA